MLSWILPLPGDPLGLNLLASPWSMLCQLDEDDLDEAIMCGLSGIALRVEHDETLDTTWVPITVLAVERA